MDQRKRIAIYGGTFDPVHSGHLEIARRVSQLFAIDEFLFVPARVAPHKHYARVSPGFHRHAMLALATQRDPKLLVSTFELSGPERQYTVDTLLHFRSELGETVDLFFVMGADSWAELPTWREWERLTTLASLVVVTRPGYEFRSDSVGPAVGARVVDVRGLTGEEIAASVETRLENIFVTDAVMFDVSATAIRQAASESRDSLEKLVPLEVAEYIRKYGLYRNTNEA